MEKTPLRWLRALAETGKADPADVLMLCDRVEALEKEREALAQKAAEYARIPLERKHTVFLTNEA